MYKIVQENNMSNITPVWITIKEASKLANTCDRTVRRWVTKHKNNVNCVEYRKGVYYINAEMLDKDYHFVQSPGQSTNTSKPQEETDYTNIHNEMDIESKVDTNEKLALMTLSKQSQDIAHLLLNKPFYRLPVFWVTVGFIMLIVAIVSAGYLYRLEILNNYQSQLTSKAVDIKEVKTELQSTKEQYQAMLNEVKSSYQKLTSEQERQINELNKKLKDLEASVKSQTSETVFKNIDKPIITGQGTDTEKIPINPSK